MDLKSNYKPLLVIAAIAAAPTVHADAIIFFQDFETRYNWQKTAAEGGTQHSPVATSVTYSNNYDAPGDGNTTPEREYGELYQNSLGGGVTESIFTDQSTALVTSTPNNFSVTTRNWDIHNGSQSGRISGYRNNDGSLPNPGPGTNQTAQNLNMSGNMLGHVKTGYELPDELEDNFYQVTGLALSNVFEDITLSFDFDAYIYGDGDGFALGVSTDGGTTFALLNPDVAGGSDMQYQSLASYDYDLRSWVTPTPNSGTQTGFGGGGHQAGTALFDLSGFAGQTIALRFAFTTNNMNSGSGDGINIDNIKVTGICEQGTSGPNCEPPPPGTGVPEPASLSLALLGLAAAARRRLRLS